MIRLADRKDCCGCGACAAVCPHGAIEMVPDGMGFRYPRVALDRCVDCHLCEDICSFADFAAEASGCKTALRCAPGPSRTSGSPHPAGCDVPPRDFVGPPGDICPDGAWPRVATGFAPAASSAASASGTAASAEAIRFPELMDQSQSGGLAFALMRKAIRSGMVVYGAAMDDDFVVRHRRVETLEGLDPLRLSKYVQSDMEGDFSTSLGMTKSIAAMVLADLKAGRRVLFTGTPCQCAGVGSLCRNYRDQLLLADILCHGVPAPYVWRDYLAEQERRHGKKLTRALFRDPSLGWHEHKEVLFFGDERVVCGEYTDLFYRHLMLRPSCLVCPYASVSRATDLTMADCWGVEKALPGFADDNRGCSLLLRNTLAGVDFSADFPSEVVERRPVELENVMQPNFLAPSQPKDGAQLFENTYIRRGYPVAERRCRPGAIRIRLLRWARKAGIKL